MKKKIKLLLSCFVLLFTVVTLSGCERANIYREFNNNGSSLAKSHILNEVSYKELYKLVDKTGEDDFIYVFFGTATNSASCTAVSIWNEQAQQYQIKTLYWLDSDLSSKKLDKIEERLGINNIDTVPALWSFNNGKIYFDSSSSKCSKDGNVSLSNTELAENCFKNLTSVRSN